MDYDKKLKCHLRRVDCNLETHQTQLYFPFGHCCDMTGAIEVGKHFDPQVQLIQTWAGELLDTKYQFVGGNWRAYPATRG